MGTKVTNKQLASSYSAITHNHDTVYAKMSGWQPPATGAIFNGTDAFFTPPTALGAVRAFEILVYPTTTNRALLTFGTNMGVTFNASNVIQYGSSFANVTTYINGVPGTTLTLNAWNHIVATFDEITATTLEVGRSGSTYLAGTVTDVTTWNRALTTVEMVARWNNGAPWLAQVPYEDRGANNTNLTPSNNFTSGWATIGGATITNATTFAGNGDGVFKDVGFVVGKKYRINALITNTVPLIIRNTNTDVNQVVIPVGDGVSRVVEFTVPYNSILYFQLGGDGTVAVENLTITPIGCTYESSSFGKHGVIDGMNSNHGNVSGGVVSLTEGSRPLIYKDVKVACTGNTTLTDIVPRGYKVTDISIRNTTANAVTVSLGSSAGGTQLVNALAVGANTNAYAASAVATPFSATAAQTLYLHSADWNSSSVNILLTMMKVSE